MPTPEQVAKALLCLSSTVGEDGAINVNVVGTDPTVGTTEPTFVDLSADTFTVPAGWRSFNIIVYANEGAQNAVVDGTSVRPGTVISHGTNEGYPGTAFDVTSMDIDSPILVTYTTQA